MSRSRLECRRRAHICWKSANHRTTGDRPSFAAREIVGDQGPARQRERDVAQHADVCHRAFVRHGIALFARIALKGASDKNRKAERPGLSFEN